MPISIQEAEQYFSSIGFDLRGGRGTGKPWMLVSPEGWEWDEHGSLAGVWAEWLEHAANVLREEVKLTRFTVEFEVANGELRADLVKELEMYVEGHDPELLTQIFTQGQVDAITPESLPDDWPDRLAANRESWMNWKPFQSTAFDAIDKIDPAAVSAWESWGGSIWVKRWR